MALDRVRALSISIFYLLMTVVSVTDVFAFGGSPLSEVDSSKNNSRSQLLSLTGMDGLKEYQNLISFTEQMYFQNFDCLQDFKLASVSTTAKWLSYFQERFSQTGTVKAQAGRGIYPVFIFKYSDDQNKIVALEIETTSFFKKERTQFRLFHFNRQSHSEIAIWSYESGLPVLTEAFLYPLNSINIPAQLIQYSFVESQSFTRVLFLNPDPKSLEEIYPKRVQDYLPWVVLGRELYKELYSKNPTKELSSPEDRRKEADLPAQTWITMVDSGVDYNHPAIASYLDRSRLGFDVQDDDPLPYDDTDCMGCTSSGLSHGTAVAGALTSGLSSDIKIYTIRLVGNERMKELTEEITRAYRLGSRVVNLSIADDLCEYWILFDEIVRTYPEMFFVFAASNTGKSLNERPLCPAIFKYPNTLTVGSVNSQKRWSSFSAYSPEFVQLAAIGESLYLPQARGGWKRVSGTSFTAPQVARVIAAIQRARPGIRLSEIRRCIQETLQMSEELKAYTEWGGVLDSKAAYACALSLPTQSY